MKIENFHFEYLSFAGKAQKLCFWKGSASLERFMLRMGVCLILLFYSSSVLGLSINVPEDVLLYPDQEFYLIMTIENEGAESSVNVVGYSEGLNLSWNRTILLLEDSGVKVGFVINPISDVGEYDIIWSAVNEDGEVVQASTDVLVSTMEGAIGNIIGYYGFELDELEGYSDSEYASDARKNIATARDLADRGMMFEATKYLDFARESLEVAIEEESPRRVVSRDFVSIAWSVGFWVLVLAVLVLAGFVFRKVFWKIKMFVLEFRVSRLRDRKKSVVSFGNAKPKYVLDIANMRRKINGIEDKVRRQELLVDLTNCEEKFRLGLPLLGRAYLDRIGRAVRRISR